MRRSRNSILKLLAVFAMIASISGLTGLSAAAAPSSGPGSWGDPYIGVSAALCGDLLGLGVIDANGQLLAPYDVDINPPYGPMAGLGLSTKLGAIDNVIVFDTGAGNSIVAGACAALLPPTTFAWTVYAVYDAGDGSFPVIPGAAVTFDGLGESGVTGPDGGFTTTGSFVAGNYPVTVSADGYVTATQTISFDAQTRSWSIILSAEAPVLQGYMTVLVEDENGGIVVGAEVIFDDIAEGGTVFPNDGSFTTSIPYAPGTYTFTVLADGFVTQSGSLTIVEDNVSTVVVLAAEAPVLQGYMTVLVEDENGDIIPGAEVIFDGIAEGGTVFPNDGSFTTSMQYAPGTYTFTVSADGFVTQTGSLTIVEDNVSTVVVLLAEQIPTPDPTETPDVTPTETPDVTPTETPDVTPTETPDKGDKKPEEKKSEEKKSEKKVEVSELPKTGSGHESSTLGATLMLSAAAAVVATTGGIVIRQKRG